ncbi:hypothetical protein D3C85_1090210 [compost metagenome]
MDIREEFETWIDDYGWSIQPDSTGLVGRYEDDRTQLAWEAWQASRDTLEIELPDDGIEDCQREWGEGCKDTFDCGYNFSCSKHEQAIHSAGIRTK